MTEVCVVATINPLIFAAVAAFGISMLITGFTISRFMQ